MKTLLALILASLAITSTCNAQRAKWPPTSDWYSVWHKGWPYTWSFQEQPSASVLIPYPAFYQADTQHGKDLWLQQVLTRRVQGDIRGKTVSVTFTVNVPQNGGGWWPFNGWRVPEYGNQPARVKLFLLGYDALYAQVSSRTPNLPDLTQWSRTQFVLPELPGSYTVTLTAPLLVNEWSNVNGQTSQAGIDICARDVKQIGLSLSGGKWFSVGIGSPQPIESTITVHSISVQ